MTTHAFTLAGAQLTALPSGALYWPEQRLLTVSDLHLGKSERRARLQGQSLPPYETRDTLTRLEADLKATNAATVICLGDSFDDTAAASALSEDDTLWIQTLQAGRRWVWIEGNHDPEPLDIGGSHLSEAKIGPITFRHVAVEGAEPGEISGHYHPKARLRAARRPCFMVDQRRMILPAYGCYTGGLDWTTPVLRALFDEKAIAYLTGRSILAVPVPRAA